MPLIVVAALGAVGVFTVRRLNGPGSQPAPVPAPQPISIARPETVRIEIPAPTPPAPAPAAPAPDTAAAAIPVPDRGSRVTRRGQRRLADAERAAATPVSERAEVEAAIGRFSDAFRSRDLSRVRRAYPGMTPAQAQEWGTFFLDARNLDSRLDVTSYEVRDDEIVAQLTGGLDWESLKTGRAESRTVSYRATLMRDKTGWRLSSLR